MEGIEEQLGSVLNNPQLMQQIMAMAQTLGQESTPPPPPKETPVTMPDPAMLQKLVGIASAAGQDEQQKALLCALDPYLSRDRLHKLERAMQAAKLAGAASAFLNAGGLQMLSGR